MQHTSDRKHHGDERLLLTCLAVEQLCADRTSARARLELELGPSARALVVSLARRDTSPSFRGSSQWQQRDARRFALARA